MRIITINATTATNITIGATLRFFLTPVFFALLAHAQCNPDEFLGSGTGANEEEALKTAYFQLALQINSSVKRSEKYTQSQKMSGGKESLSSDYASETAVEASPDDEALSKSSLGSGLFYLSVGYGF
jgi:hypothetical protein